MRRPLWLLLALLALHFAIVLRHHARPLITDEIYYAAKARYFAEHGAFPKASPRELDLVSGKVWGLSDWRPPGYPVFLSLFGPHDEAALRLRVTIVQFVLVAALLVAVFVLARGGWLAALLFGLSPWPLEFSNDIGPDALNAFLAGLALLLAWKWSAAVPAADQAAFRSRWWLFAATVVASSTLLFRAEMIVMAVVIAAAAWLVRRDRTWRDAAAAMLAFALVAGVQVAYRTSFTGQLGVFGALRIHNRGAFAWTRTWPGTEKEAYDFVYAVTEGRVEELPARAFGDESERATVLQAMERARQHGYTEDVDNTFARLAEKRRRERPLLVGAIRASNVVQLWVHIETPPQILDALASVPRAIRRPFLAFLHLLKLAAVLLGLFAGARAVRRWWRGEADALDVLTLLMFVYIVGRTLLIGIALDWKVHRYVVSAWIPMLWCAISPTLWRRSASRVP